MIHKAVDLIQCLHAVNVVSSMELCSRRRYGTTITLPQSTYS